MKSIYERIKNNIRPILQLLLLVGVFFAPRIFKITELIKTPPKLEASQKICDYVFYFAWKGGDWAIGVFFFIKLSAIIFIERIIQHQFKLHIYRHLNKVTFRVPQYL